MKSNQEAMRRADEAFKALTELFAGPLPPPGKDRWHHRQYIPARLDDGSIGFVREPFSAEVEAIFNEAWKNSSLQRPSKTNHFRSTFLENCSRSSNRPPL
jgi:hypothetical protein